MARVVSARRYAQAVLQIATERDAALSEVPTSEEFKEKQFPAT